MKTITEYREAVLTILGDSTGRRYSESQLDMAIQEALGRLNSYRPNKETVKVKIAEMRGPEAVLRWVPEPSAEILTVRGENGRWYNAADYRTGGKTYIQFYGDAIPEDGETLALELTRPHIIQGLNGEQTTVPAGLSLTVCSGAAGYAMRIRARSVTEVFGKRPEDTVRLIDQSNTLIGEYLAELGRDTLIAHDPLPRGGWNA